MYKKKHEEKKEHKITQHNQLLTCFKLSKRKTDATNTFKLTHTYRLVFMNFPTVSLKRKLNLTSSDI